MNIEELRAYALSLKGATEDMPFGPTALAFRVCNKIFALVSLDEDPVTVNLKCDPERAVSLREEYEEIIPGFHMNKTHWNTVSLTGRMTSSLVEDLVEHSYSLIVKSLPKAERTRLAEMQ